MRATAYLFIAFLLFSVTVLAQEQLGLRTGNFSGLNGLAINPAAHLTTPFNWEIGLSEGAFFFDNNYTFLRNTSLLGLARPPKELNFAFGPDHDNENPPPQGSVVLDFYDDGRKRYAQGLVSVMGPAFYVRLNGQHTLGLFSRARAFASGRGLVNAFSYYRYFNRPFFEPFQVDAFKTNIAAWGELGLNYMYQTEVSNGTIGFGISMRYLQPWEGIYFNNKEVFPLAKLPGDSLSGGPIQFEYAHTYSNLQPSDRRIASNGMGAAIDMGITYVIGDVSDYSWRLGFSVLDIGRLHFNTNARMHKVNTTGESVIGFDDYDDFVMPDQLESMLELFSAQVLGDPSASTVSGRFGMWLPGAVSIQADRNFGGGFYLSGLIVQGIPLGGAAMWRSGLIALTPRFERRWMEFALPVSLYHGNRMQVGISGRLGPLTLGTDRLGGIFTGTNLSGADFYFALKINPFRIQSTASDKDPRRGGGARALRAARVKVGAGEVKCYKF